MPQSGLTPKQAQEFKAGNVAQCRVEEHKCWHSPGIGHVLDGLMPGLRNDYRVGDALVAESPQQEIHICGAILYDKNRGFLHNVTLYGGTLESGV